MKNKIFLILALVLILLPISLKAQFTLPIQFVETDSSDVSAWNFINSLNGIMQFTDPAYFDSTVGGLMIVTFSDSTGMFDTTWAPFQQYVADNGGGAPTGVNYLVGTADATLTNEIVVGLTPGGSLGGTWASPTVDDDSHNHTTTTVSGLLDGDVSDAITVNPVNTTTETAIEAVVDLQDLQGAVTDAQVPNNITIDLATESDTTHKIDTNYVPFQEYVTNHAGAAGEANTSSTVGSGFSLTHPKSGDDLPFKSITGGDAITLDTATANELNIAFDGGATPTNELAGTWAIPQIADGVIDEPNLDVTNAPTDNQLLSYNAASTNFTWVDSPAGGSGGVWADTTGVTDVVWFVDSEGDTLIVVHDSTNGQAIIQAGRNQSLAAILDSLIIIGTGTGKIIIEGATSGELTFSVEDIVKGGFLSMLANDTVIAFVRDTLNDTTLMRIQGALNISDMGFVKFLPMTSNPSHEEGLLFYDDGNKALAWMSNVTGSVLQIGQEVWTRVRNISGVTLLDGKAVYVTGATANLVTVDYAQADLLSTSSSIGLVTNPTGIAHNSNGFVTTIGAVRDIKTDDFSIGRIYLSADTAGAWVSTKPTIVIPIGYITNVHVTQGEVLVDRHHGVIDTMDVFNLAAYLDLRLDTANWNSAVTHITSDGSDHTFIDQDVTIGSSPTFDGVNITGTVTGTVEQIHITVVAGTSTIGAGNPIYATAYNSGTGVYTVEISDASDPATMPAIAITSVSTPTSGPGVIAVERGRTTGLTTDTITGAALDSGLFVADGGGLTITRPTGNSDVQRIGFLGNSHSSQGVIQVTGAGRVNALPNIPDANFWVGDGDSLPVPVIMSGNATMTNTGVVTVSMATLSDSTDAITDGGVDVVDLANDALAAMGDSARAAAADTATGIRNGSDWTGAHDYGGATSLEIPNGTAPAPTTEGQIYQDTDDDMLEGTDGTNDFVFAQRYHTLWLPIDNPGNLTSDTILIPIRGFAPGGIIIDSIGVGVHDSTGTYIVEFEEWTSRNVTTGTESAIATITVPGNAFDVATGSIAHTIEYGNLIMIEVPVTAQDRCDIWIRYEVLGND